MGKQEILRMVEDAFDKHVTSWASNTILGLESGIEGKEEFIKEVQDKLKEMFDDETLE